MTKKGTFLGRREANLLVNILQSYIYLLYTKQYTNLITWELWFTMGAAQGFFEVRYNKKSNGQIDEYVIEHFNG